MEGQASHQRTHSTLRMIRWQCCLNSGLTRCTTWERNCDSSKCLMDAEDRAAVPLAHCFTLQGCMAKITHNPGQGQLPPLRNVFPAWSPLGSAHLPSLPRGQKTSYGWGP